MRSIERTLVRIYKWVRDLPYEVELNRLECLDEGLRYIKTKKRGSCSSKHYLLGSMYEKIGVPVTYLTYPFHWKDLEASYPDFIKRLAEKMPLQYHCAIKISLDGQSFFLDATWDPPLGKVGFPINQIGEVLVNTENGVIPSGECIDHHSVLERNKYMKKITAGMKYTGVEQGFYSAFNQWLEKVRKT